MGAAESSVERRFLLSASPTTGSNGKLLASAVIYKLLPAGMAINDETVYKV